MVGKTYGGLEVIADRTPQGKKPYYECRCTVCGGIVVKSGYEIRRNPKSCGCIARKESAARAKSILPKYNITHGSSRTRLYRCWCNMKNRCYYPKHERYSQYGGRGIKVCDEWLNDFSAFKKWAEENGYREDLTIDRIDVNGNYEPSNCRWIPGREQYSNIQRNVYLTVDGVTHTATEWTRIVGCGKNTILERHKKGWSDRECVYGKEK